MIAYPFLRVYTFYDLSASVNRSIRESLTRFHSRSAPGISVLDYLRRIVRFANVEVSLCVTVEHRILHLTVSCSISQKKTCLLITLHYIDQICARHPLFTLSSLTCHRFIIASVTVSSKCLCDTFCTNNLYAKVGGISVTELNILEREFLEKIEWQLMVSISMSSTSPSYSVATLVYFIVKLLLMVPS